MRVSRSLLVIALLVLALLSLAAAQDDSSSSSTADESSSSSADEVVSSSSTADDSSSSTADEALISSSSTADDSSSSSAADDSSSATVASSSSGSSSSSSAQGGSASSSSSAPSGASSSSSTGSGSNGGGANGGGVDTSGYYSIVGFANTDCTGIAVPFVQPTGCDGGILTTCTPNSVNGVQTSFYPGNTCTGTPNGQPYTYYATDRCQVGDDGTGATKVVCGKYNNGEIDYGGGGGGASSNDGPASGSSPANSSRSSSTGGTGSSETISGYYSIVGFSNTDCTGFAIPAVLTTGCDDGSLTTCTPNSDNGLQLSIYLGSGSATCSGTPYGQPTTLSATNKCKVGDDGKGSSKVVCYKYNNGEADFDAAAPASAAVSAVLMLALAAVASLLKL